MTRPMTADGQPGRAQEKDFAFGKSKGAFGKGLGMGRVSMDANRGSKVYDDAVARRNAGSQPRAVTAEDITEEIKPERLKKSSLDMARSTSPSEGADALESDARIKMLIEDLQREKDGGAAGGERRKSGEISRGTSQDGMRRSQDLGGKRSSQDGKRGSQDGKPAPFKRGACLSVLPPSLAAVTRNVAVRRSARPGRARAAARPSECPAGHQGQQGFLLRRCSAVVVVFVFEKALFVIHPFTVSRLHARRVDGYFGLRDSSTLARIPDVAGSRACGRQLHRNGSRQDRDGKGRGARLGQHQENFRIILGFVQGLFF
ncbi:hypothetical protein T484DRAFT_2139257 [Baffinella frigidus]|nr:hypothetical protein T484DRAFT_2139257 [Cryptophyta sp. CCMP2293]